MSDRALADLARAAGLQVNWTDATGRSRHASLETQRHVLAALSLGTESTAAIKDSLGRLKEERARPAPLEVVRQGARIGTAKPNLCLIDERGRERTIKSNGGFVPAPTQPGYYVLAGSARRIAVVPSRAFHPALRSAWAIGIQLYSLKGGTTKGFGDFAALRDFARRAAASGADAVAISPVHALFWARPDHISPYAPSTRLFFNPLYAPSVRAVRSGPERLVNWPVAAREKWQTLLRASDRFANAENTRAFRDFVRRGGKRLLDHARFEVLDARFRAQGLKDWHEWPWEFRDLASAPARALNANDPDIAFQLFLQWRADQGLASAQQEARRAGMRIGLVIDMAVGMDPGGSHAWSAPTEILQRLTMGAPPDFFNGKGQNWGLTNLSPLALRRTGFAGFIDTVRCAMRHAGGIRLDHAMGLERLWVIPQGADARDGVYLRYPRKALMGLLALESVRHRTLVVAEDLGTVPRGFRGRLNRAGIPGMRVLWFERDAKGGFLPPKNWDPPGVALSTTHDLPTLAGWWSGRDLEWRAIIGWGREQVTRERKVRARERKAMWQALRECGAVKGARPAPSQPGRFIDGAFRALAKATGPLKLLPIEDFIGAREQPNIPGTIDEHPNWRRRLKDDRALAASSAKKRAAILNGRSQP